MKIDLNSRLITFFLLSWIFLGCDNDDDGFGSFSDSKLPKLSRIYWGTDSRQFIWKGDSLEAETLRGRINKISYNKKGRIRRFRNWDFEYDLEGRLISLQLQINPDTNKYVNIFYPAEDSLEIEYRHPGSFRPFFAFDLNAKLDGMGNIIRLYYLAREGRGFEDYYALIKYDNGSSFFSSIPQELRLFYFIHGAFNDPVFYDIARNTNLGKNNPIEVKMIEPPRPWSQNLYPSKRIYYQYTSKSGFGEFPLNSFDSVITDFSVPYDPDLLPVDNRPDHLYYYLD